jgi:hypothetical protein
MAASVIPLSVPNETVTAAYELGNMSTAIKVEEFGSIGNGPAGGADVQWYTFTLDQPALIVSKLERQQNNSSFEGALSLFNNDPYDFYDPYDADGYRLLDQVDQPANGGDATLEQLLGPGTYYLAVSGAGNDYFNPLLADSGVPGTTGDFDLLLSAHDTGLTPATGPQVLTTDPAPSAVLSSSPLVIRVDVTGPLDTSTLNPGQTVDLIFSPNGTFGPDDEQIPFSWNFSDAINELQLYPDAPLAPGYYEVFLAGNSDLGAAVVADLNENDLNADPGHPDGQDFTYNFQVDGIDGRTGTGARSDDTAATAKNLGALTSAAIVQVAGAIGDDPFYGPTDSPCNQVNMYNFSVSGQGRYALVAEVFAGRIGSSLDPGVSLFELDPSDGSLVFLAGNNNTFDPVVATDGFSRPLYTDSALFASVTAGDYYLAVASGSNTLSPFEGLPPGSPGLFNPNVSHSGQDGSSVGPYVLNVLVQPAPSPPHVVSTSPKNGASLTEPPTQLTLSFDEPVNIAQLAFETFQVADDTKLTAVYIEGADGTKYYPRFDSYDSATNQATFLMLDALPNGNYELHLSGSAGLTDLGGNELVGNDPSGDYVVRFAVDGPARGTDGNPLDWNDQEPNDDIQGPQNLGVLFPNELAAGITIIRDFSQDPSQAVQDTEDVYKIQIPLDGDYSFSLTGENLPDTVTIKLTDSTGQTVPIGSIGGALLFGEITPGTYLLIVNGWNMTQAPDISYQISFDLVSTNDNAPPLVSGPAAAVAIRLSSAAEPTSPTTAPPSVTPPPGPTDPPLPVTSPDHPETTIALPPWSQDDPDFSGGSLLGVVVLANGSVGGVTGSEGAEALSTQFIASANTSSTVTTALIAIGTPFPILGLGEHVDASTPGPVTVEEEMTKVAVAPLVVGARHFPETLSRLTAMVRELLARTAMRSDLPSNVSIAPEPSSLDPAEFADIAVEALHVPNEQFSAGPETPADGRESRRAWSFVVACVGLATVWCVKRREHCRRLASRGERPRFGAHSPSPHDSWTPFVETVSRASATTLATVRRLDPPAAPQSIETGVSVPRLLQPLVGAGVNDE